ncbi:class I SAM-dependent methyltransferase [Mariprofundus sp. KV]|uniref:class I SAM-dependent methyltransferase n=1 Tax=Mariprofundus sp. KV TaxID=2608715 RepID=UPI00159FB07C|nr:class I SAM-dependent methyltransferase [Mariprofundus sp. KV]NWF36774.1 class I SAM-dependent methyltransferase [Mariprofundus sp. KV]
MLNKDKVHPVADSYCPSCHSDDVTCIGKIPASGSFGGRVLEHAIAGAYLFRCESCQLYFRYPKLPTQKLEELYQLAVNESWSTTFTERVDWVIASQWIGGSHEFGDVLDIGCNDGVFLTGLGDEYSRYGIELNADSAKRAEERGVQIIGQHFEDVMKQTRHGFDVITAFDVIEHVEDPLYFMQLIADKLNENGEIVISTGNTASKTWTFMGSKYWYCHYPEHITFINPEWVNGAAQKLGLRVVDMALFSHSRSSMLFKVSEVLKNLMYMCFPSLTGWLRIKGFGAVNVTNHRELVDQPPGWVSAKDHIIIRLQKMTN